MSTPGTPLPGDVEYASHLESPTAPLAYCPYDLSDPPGSHTTFLNYRNPQGSAIGGASTTTSTFPFTSTNSNSTAYHDPTSSEFRNRKIKEVEDEDTILHGADPNRRRSMLSSSNFVNGPLMKDGSLGHLKTGHDAVDDLSNSFLRSRMGSLMGGGRIGVDRPWSAQPLVLAMMWLGFVAIVYAGWRYLGEFNREGKRSLVGGL